MLIALFALLSSMVFGGSDNVFLVPDLKKEIKSTIQDDSNKKQALDILKESEKESKAFNKRLKQYTKTALSYNSSHTVSREDFEKLLDSAAKEHKKFQDYFIDQRIKIQGLMSSSEWDSIAYRALHPAPKKKAKTEKNKAKAIGAFHKSLTHTREVIEQTISDPEAKEKALASSKRLEDALISLVDQELSFSLDEKAVLRDQKATKAELTKLYDEALGKFRHEFYEKLLDFHFEVVELTDEQQLKKIAKAMHKGW